MNEKLITALLAILLALGGWTLQRTFSLSQDMVLIKTKVEIIDDEVPVYLFNTDTNGVFNKSDSRIHPV